MRTATYTQNAKSAELIFRERREGKAAQESNLLQGRTTASPECCPPPGPSVGISYFAFEPPSPQGRRPTPQYPTCIAGKDWPEFGQVLCPPPWLVRTSDVGRTEM